MNWSTENVGQCVDLRLTNRESDIVVKQTGDFYRAFRWDANLETSLLGYPVMTCSSPECLVEWLARRNYTIVGSA